MLEKLCFRVKYVLPGKIRNELQSLCDDESGMGTIEVVLILVVLIALVIIFRKAITGLLNDIFDQINEDAESVYNP